ncbi:MAG: zinc ribbon domain-containing protein [Saprospiraceae bacterium]|nr:zinc ribbon domain-containing protein [Saprospiraceae bacterium]MCF8249263.1 zinc ribbon domain-containing protein [Saprospiraceae bacterium]MCF8281169.1 zinc ribbon domain-containing protein [Bacteroidales bacterium]MCF8311460.1 zinc ribbon domain-containing protein [Saprospiraceae bacterium]MCF8439882.1 zinc ribbon domain-containing protein [Saprospiraceae bacterium]
MKNCRNCQKPMPDDARFCPACGTSVIVETFDCPNCGTENDLSAPACSNCHLIFKSTKKEPPKAKLSDIFDNSHTENLEQAIADRFSLAFEKRLKEEHHPSLHNAYIDRFYKSEFRGSVDFRIKQLAEQAQRNPDGDQKFSFAIPALEDMLDYFIIRYCEDLNEAAFDEKILKYQGRTAKEIQLGEMLLDYLDFNNEGETVYTNFVTMPANKLKNAAQNFLFPQKGETIFFICDLSTFGACKDGFAMTRDCIYWKMPLEKKQRVYFKNLEEIKRQEDWIIINGIFFNASKSLNIKLLRLLKKLKELYGTK